MFKSEETHRLMTLAELVKRYPKSYFNESGELIYVKSRNRYVISPMLHWLGKWHPGFHNHMYVKIKK